MKPPTAIPAVAPGPRPLLGSWIMVVAPGDPVSVWVVICPSVVTSDEPSVGTNDVSWLGGTVDSVVAARRVENDSDDCVDDVEVPDTGPNVLIPAERTAFVKKNSSDLQLSAPFISRYGSR